MKTNLWVLLLRMLPREGDRRKLAESLKEEELVII